MPYPDTEPEALVPMVALGHKMKPEQFLLLMMGAGILPQKACVKQHKSALGEA